MSDKPSLKAVGFLADIIQADSSEESIGQIGEFPVLKVLVSEPSKAVVQSVDSLTDRKIRIALFPKSSVKLDEIRSRILPGHDFLYPVHILTSIDDHPSLIMPELPGDSLAQALIENGPFALKDALRITREILVGLAVGRDHGLSHGFLSPSWVYLERSTNNSRLMGLGWRLLEPVVASELSAFMTSEGTYIPAPEVAEGRPGDERSDTFGAGCLLYQMITGNPPFPGDSPLSIIRSLALVDPQPPSELVAGLPEVVDKLVSRLLAKDPKSRPATAREAAKLVKELETSLASSLSVKPKPVAQVAVSDDEIGLVPLESEFSRVQPLKAAPSKAEALNVVDDDDDLMLIDFAEPLAVASSSSSKKPPADDMLIDLLPIDDEAVKSPSQQSAPNQARKSPATATQRNKPGAAYESMKTPLEWVFVADTPVEAVHLSSETQKILIRDQSGRVVCLSSEGELLASEVTPEPIRISSADQAGQLIAFILGKRSLVLMDWDLNLLVERKLHSEPISLAVDPLGLYVAVGFIGNETRLYTRQGKPAGDFETRQPLAHMGFMPGTAKLLGSTKFDQLICAELEQGKGYQLDPEVAWTQNTGVAIGHMHVIGGAAKILAACHNMGLQRLNIDGENEGTYQLGGTVIESASDYPGRFFLASTLEGSLMAVNANGSVMWEHPQGGPWRHLCVDALGRYGLAASALGEVVKMDLSTEPRAKLDNSGVRILSATGGTGGGSTVRAAEWSVRIAGDDENTTDYSLCVVDRPWRLCVLDTKKKLNCFIEDGDEAEEIPALGGSGRMLKSRDGWVAVANDRTLVLCNVSKSETIQPELDLVQITHFDMRPAQYGLLIIQEADRIGRATVAGRWVWRVSLPATVESLVLADDGYAGLSLDNGLILILDSSGKAVGKWSAGEQEAVLLCESQGRNEGLCRWVSLARQERILRGHALDGRVLWQVETPFAPWELVRTGQGVVVSGNDNGALLYDDSGQVIATRRATSQQTRFATAIDNSALALYADAGQVFCTRFDGTVLWRIPIDGEVTATALSSTGAAVLAGGVLSWVSHPDLS